jgi:tetratricopeptide (TPR) repeat protein
VKVGIIIACVVAGWLAQPTTKTQGGDLFTSTDVRDWLGAAAEHQPGVEDAALTRIAAWSGGKLLRTLGDATRQRSTEELNALLERAALLHADIMLLREEPNSQWTDTTEIGGGGAFLVQDGLRIGHQSLDPHIQFGRRIFASMREPLVRRGEGPPGTRLLPWDESMKRNPRIHQWYRAVSADLAARHWLADLRLHLESANRVLSETAATSFDTGCYAEVISSAQVQHSLPTPERSGSFRTLALRSEFTALLLDEELNLIEAEKQYRTALKRDPHHAEARVRLAHVLTRRERAGEAFTLLQPPLETSDPTVRYYGALALGQSAEATGKSDAAREAYEAASRLFPRAQSPLLALLRLARAADDAGAADAMTARLSQLGPREQDRLDPWWDYYDCNGRHRNDEVQRLYDLYFAR